MYLCPFVLYCLAILISFFGTPTHHKILAEDSAFQNLNRSVRALSAKHAGKVSIAIEFVKTGEKILINESRPMPSASLIKVAVMVEAYRQIEENHLQLDQRLTLKKEDKVPGSGILTSHFDDGLQLTLKDAIRLMIRYSDNTATNLVIDQVGLQNVCSTMEGMGFPNTKINSKVYRASTSTISKERSQQFGLGSSTALETMNLLKLLHQRKVVSTSASNSMLNHLLTCDDDTKIGRFLPTGTRFANKSGAISHARCDAGIIETKSGPIVVVVFTSNNQDKSWTNKNQAERLCSEVGRLAYSYATNTGIAETQPVLPVVLAEGSTGTQVEDLQRTLNAKLKPSPNLAVDGDFGPATRAAVTAFQKKNKLKIDGRFDADDWKSLGVLITKSQPVPSPKEINEAILRKKPADELTGQPFVTAKSWAMANLNNGKILHGHEKDKILDIASTTKIMTAHLVVQLAEKNPAVLEELVTFSKRADKTRGSTSGVRAGEILPVKELLYGLMLPSGNDASVALAEHFGQRLQPAESSKTAEKQTAYDGFIRAMNTKARFLGMKQTVFRNPHGLTANGHQSTASDLVKLASAAMKSKLFRKYVSTRQRGCTVNSTTGYQRNLVWKNTNQLLGIEDYQGIKTGTTTAAGACLVSVCKKGDQELVLVVLGSGSSRGRYADSRNLFRWAWQQQTPRGDQTP